MKIFNTLSRQKEEFKPKHDVVTLYVCGVTVYDDCHIGHAMSYVLFDVIRRYLEFKGYTVKHVQNFTDIDDKIINRARERRISAQDLAEQYIAEYFRDMDALNITRAHIYPRATEEVSKIVEVIQGLIAKGHAYEAGGSVYFRVKTFPGYGKLSRRNLDDMVSGSSEEAGKEDLLDFALWKGAKPGEPFWASHWGNGRPGWHIECSAMSLKYLGDSIDIHGGGQDLIFPHHENEIAQSEAFTGVAPFVRYWLHNGLLQMGGDKMSKSLGNLVTVKQILEHHSADALRLFILGSHYRSPLTYSEESLLAAETGMERLRQALRDIGGAGGGSTLDASQFQHRFIESMDDDFNVAQAIGVLFDLAREINRGRDEGLDVTRARQTLAELAGVMGFTMNEPAKPQLAAEPFIELLISLRSDLRKAKQWQISDTIRDRLAELGVIMEDTPKGTVWKRSL